MNFLAVTMKSAKGYKSRSNGMLFGSKSWIIWNSSFMMAIGVAQVVVVRVVLYIRVIQVLESFIQGDRSHSHKQQHPKEVDRVRGRDPQDKLQVK